MNFLVFHCLCLVIFQQHRSSALDDAGFVVSQVANALLQSGSPGGAFAGEVGAQKLRARTAGLAQGMSVVFGLIFNTPRSR